MNDDEDDEGTNGFGCWLLALVFALAAIFLTLGAAGVASM